MSSMAELSNDGKGASICAVLGNHFPNPHRVVYYLLLWKVSVLEETSSIRAN